MNVLRRRHKVRRDGDVVRGVGLKLVLVLLGLSVGAVATGCAENPSFNEVTVVGTDYAFEMADTLPPGPTVFVLENRGAVRHEMGMGLLKEGLTMEEAFAAEESGEDALEASVGFLYADAEEQSLRRLLVDLQPGRRYGLVCFLRDHPDAPQHTDLGIHHSFVVE